MVSFCRNIGRVGAGSGPAFLLGLGCVVLPQSSSAHVIVRELSEMGKGAVAREYLTLGFRHILPLGFDHILFILSMVLLSPRLKPLIVQTSAFTLAHSITLGLSVYGVIHFPSRVVEPLIAGTIFFVAVENLFVSRLKPGRILIVFLFGLIHGLGFAAALTELGLPQSSYLLGIVLFNAGVELGQLTVVLAAYFILIRGFAAKPGYRKLVLIPVSSLIAVVSLYWLFERLFS